jgi:hypothetical protein
MSTTTVMPYLGSATPWLPGPNWRGLGSVAEETSATPLALASTPSALREAVLKDVRATRRSRDRSRYMRWRPRITDPHLQHGFLWNPDLFQGWRDFEHRPGKSRPTSSVRPHSG